MPRTEDMVLIVLAALAVLALLPATAAADGLPGSRTDDAGTSWLPIAAPTAALLVLLAATRRRLRTRAA